MQELTNKRTYTAKHFDNGDGTFTMSSHIGHIHYKENGEFLDSDLTPEDKGAYYEMAKHNYKLQVAKNFADPLLMRYTNKYEGANHTITYEPYALAWFNPQTDDVQIFRNQQSVEAVYNSDTNSFYYEGAFGAGIDFEIKIQRSGFTKEIVIPNEPNNYPTAPSANHRMVALFKYGGSGLKILKDTNEEWDKTTVFEHKGGFDIAEETNPALKSFIRPAYGYDSDDRQIALKVLWVKRGGQLWQVKEIPLEKMKKAVFPVRFDTTTEYTPHGGDAYTIIDNASWSTARNAATADSVVNATSLSAANRISGTYNLRRSFLAFDLSSIADTDVVSAVDFKLTPKILFDADNGGFNIVASTQSSPTTLATTDHDQVGSTRFITSDVDVGDDLSVDTEYTASLNSSGISHVQSAVSADGYAMFAIRTRHDLDNTAPVGSWSGLNPYHSEEGATKTPKLEVTYSAGATSNIKTIAGITQANIKSMAGITNANIKSVVGVTNS